MLQVHGLSRHFKTPEGIVRALDNVTFQVADGAIAAIVGRSGSGKTTLLSILGGLDLPTTGRIVLDGSDVTTLDPSRLVAYRQRTVGLVFQDYKLVPTLTALKNVMLPMEFAGHSWKERRERARHLLDAVGIGQQLWSRRPSRLSAGQQQRVAIARSIANSPRLLLADEPTGNLDSQTRDEVFALLASLVRGKGVSAVLVTHDKDLAAKADVAYELDDGRVVSARRREAPVQGSTPKLPSARPPTGPPTPTPVPVQGSTPKQPGGR